MSVLIYIDQSNGEAKKASLEAAYYGSQIAAKEGGDAIGLFLGEGSGLESLGNYGLKKVLHVNNAAFNNFDSKAFTKVIAEAAESTGAKTVVIPFNQNGKSLAPRVSVKLKAGYVPGASTLVDNGTVTKSVFNTDRKVIGLSANSIQVQKSDTTASVEAFNTSVSAADFASKVLSVETVEGEVPLTEAEIVVSAGRGLKGPENWGMVEDLAHALGAATACSRPVSDIGWRPHHEHVGQTGATVKPNLYIAIGISGAIQHLAGVNQSKVMVVINNDPEAPFFKAADYGIVGDAFEVVPKLVEAVKQFKAQQS